MRSDKNVLAIAPFRYSIKEFMNILSVLERYWPDEKHPFRIVLDYDPEQERVLIRVYDENSEPSLSELIGGRQEVEQNPD